MSGGQAAAPRLNGRVALVTGGTRGFGAAIARRFAAEGAKVAINYREPSAAPRAAALASELDAAGPGRAIAVQADVRDWDEVAAMTARVLDAFGRLDVLVNNAGVLSTAALETLTLDEWNRTLEVNLTGAFICIKHAVPAMLAQAGGNIINVAAAGIWTGDPMFAYTASKAGLIAMTRIVAKQLGPKGIRSNAIAPGFHHTDMSRQVLDSGVDRSFLDAIPVGFAPGPQSLADVALFLACDESRYVTGHTMVADGGMTLR